MPAPACALATLNVGCTNFELAFLSLSHVLLPQPGNPVPEFPDWQTPPNPLGPLQVEPLQEAPGLVIFLWLPG